MSVLGRVEKAMAVAAPVLDTDRIIRADCVAAMAELHSSHAPHGDVIVAEADGELWAAVSIDDGHAIANPLRPSGELTFQLIERARDIRRTRRLSTAPR